MLDQETKVRHALSFDVEDWYQGFIHRQIQGWEKHGSHEKRSLERIVEILDEHNTRATFFVLGSFAEEYQDLIKFLDTRGHEIATHGYSHTQVILQSPSSFRNDIRKSIAILERITGKKVVGHRAAFWSVTQDCLWALDILAEAGIQYDSSIFPSSLHRYGIASFPIHPHLLKLPTGRSIYEFPAQVLRIGRLRLPAAGGFYLRAFPLRITEWALQQSERSGHNGMVYLHPYDLDTEVPKIKVPFVFRVIRYYNLHQTERRLRKLLSSFHFSPVEEVLQSLKNALPGFWLLEA